MEKLIIIGAEPAGLTTTYELLKKKNNKYDVIILEASNEIGGISRKIKYNGNRIDRRKTCKRKTTRFRKAKFNICWKNRT